jgi:streptogrisin C
VHKGCLTGPAATDFDLYLEKRDSSRSWTRVASGIGSTATETVTYSGSPGVYRWRVLSYRGSRPYRLEVNKPS